MPKGALYPLKPKLCANHSPLLEPIHSGNSTPGRPVHSRKGIEPMSINKPRKRKVSRCAPKFRRQMVELHRGARSNGELAKEFGCTNWSMRMWPTQADRDRGAEQGRSTICWPRGTCIESPPARGCSSMVELQLPKLLTWVRFPSPAPRSRQRISEPSGSRRAAPASSPRNVARSAGRSRRARPRRK